MHSPRDMGKRNAKKRAAGACDLGDSLTTTGVFCSCTRSLSDASAGQSALGEPVEAGAGRPTGTPTTKQCSFSTHRCVHYETTW